MQRMKAFYTVEKTRHGNWHAKYLDRITFKVETLNGGPFADPGEASQEFKNTIGGDDSQYLEPKDFKAKVKQVENERALLSSWQKMSGR